MSQTKAELIDAKGNASFDTNTLFVDAANNRVGIGTTAAQNTLHLHKSDGLQNYLQITNATTGSSATDGALFGLNDDEDVIVWQREAGALQFGTNNAERARIDSSGRLLVGTSTSTDSLAKVQIQDGHCLLYENRDGAGAGYELRWSSNGGATGRSLASIQGAQQTPGNSGGRLVFSTTADGASTPTERMRIAQNGNVSIGTTGSEGRITIVGDSCGGYIGAITNANNSACNPAHGLIIRAGYNGPVSGSIHFSFRRPDDTVLGSISQNGGSSVAYNTSSDYRLKENIAPLSGAIDRINQLKPSQFNFITDPGKIVDGFIAHEAQAVVPECVTGEKDAVDDEGNPVYQGIDQSKLVPLLTAALQEAIAEITSLKDRLTAAGL